ncbi:hypothetical protein [Actinocatenispora comari]|uniref:Uncharacterized protein n=1 Tax=Actinocatenispora comari TaxID=2807577 RepID=A0A8J4AIA5_9ACTN|nr:hypothetical protein [Actinocatenispora comari]GIL29163.1 hypothetical protein NUM_44170 [Actinocatenispora comari]
MDSREGDGALPTPYPPAVGDLIWLTDRFTGSGAVYRVLERQWMHAGYGSMSWRAGTAAPAEGPMLEIVVEAAGGLFLDEVDGGEPQ